MRTLLRLAFEATLEHTNIVQVSRPAIRRGFERLLAREDTREMLDSLLLHIARPTKLRSGARCGS